MRHKNEDRGNTITEIKKDSKKNEWLVIGNRKRYKRNCPSCNKILFLSKTSFWRSFHPNYICRNCWRSSVKIDDKELERKCNGCNKTLRYSNKDNRNKAEKENWLCRLCSWTYKKKRIKPEDLFRNCPDCKKKLVYSSKGCRDRSEKEKASCKSCANFKRISQLKFGGLPVIPTFSERACKFIDDYGKQNGYNFQHAMNGGEFFIKDLGYWVDGYDKKKNVVFEYDEKHHFRNGNIRDKDINRMNKIKECLGCKFIRYNEILNEIKEY